MLLWDIPVVKYLFVSLFCFYGKNSHLIMTLFRLVHFPKVCWTCPTFIKLETIITTSRVSKKYVNYMTDFLNFAVIGFFYQKIEIFFILRNKHIDLILIFFFLFFNICWVLKEYFNQLDCNFDDVNKTGYPGPPFNEVI